ncbi:MFS transporter [Allostreptomyces psammosilenae]|uniref:DHA1 family inner membrane transport protein n=1 Tax=Allostreptomyces psammosilenae TaxID=1892865 RepID=A0A852ZX30_9ACTN|nr:MFS transporter [Allostreptomyces psammosilenae]NYI06916.1 DHA1 family inner membrane transport protein [Allostreptomyces psammosilenae]
MPLALLALAISAFAIGTTEFVIMGLLPDVASDMEVSIPQAGWLVSGYALGVVIGAPLLTAIAARVPRRTLLIGLMCLFVVGNLLCALAPNFWFLAVARVVAALPHGAFFGAGAVVATELAAPHLRARAVSVMFAGLTIANVVGVPGATLLGQRFGWRVTMGVVVLIGVVAVAAIVALVPHLPRRSDVGLRHELASFRSGGLWLVLATVILGCGGLFACYSYIAPMMTEVAGFAPGSMTLVLALFGIGMTLGNALGGWIADRALRPSIVLSFGLLALTLLAFSLTARAQWSAAATVVLIGAFAFAASPGLQTLVMEKAHRAPALASAANQAAFNLANALGAYLGGLVISAGYGYLSPNLVGGGLAGLGALLAALIWFADSRRGGTGRPGAASRSKVLARSDGAEHPADEPTAARG